MKLRQLGSLEEEDRRPLPLFERPKFDGPLLQPADHERLGRQLVAVRSLMLDGRWRSLAEIAEATGSPEASVSARLRDLRKPRNGAFSVDRRRRTQAQYEYRIRVEGP